jgi:hypothetical protein
MKRIFALMIAGALLTLPAAAQNKSPGKSDTAPGQTGNTPGQMQQNKSGKTGKDFAPGRLQKEPGDAKDINPGSKQRK